MAKSYKEKFRDEEGVWRTIGGRRVFIKTGQSLSQAMRESGKFRYDKMNREHKKYKIEQEIKEAKENQTHTFGERQKVKRMYGELSEEYEKANNNYKEALVKKDNWINRKNELERENFNYQMQVEIPNEMGIDIKQEQLDRLRKVGNKEQQLSDIGNKEEKYENKWNDEKYKYVYSKMSKENQDKINQLEEDMRKNPSSRNVNEKQRQAQEIYEQQLSNIGNKQDTFEVGDLKRKALETLPKDHIDSHEGDLYIKKTPQSTELLNRMKDKDSGLLSTFKDQQTGEEWYDIPFANWEDDYKEKYSHAFPFHEKTEAEKKYADDVAEYFKGKDIKEEVRKAKEEFNKSQKTGNDYLPKASKVMTSGTSNRKEVSDNIQAHILEYYDNPVDFMEQMDAMDYLPTRWKAGEELAKGGSYLIYNGDMADYLNSLNINPKGKTFSEDKSFDMYTSLVGRESERLYNRLEKLYEQYKKEHKNSNVSLDDFRKWFK